MFHRLNDKGDNSLTEMPGKESIMILLGILQQGTWAKKKLCVFTVTCQKNLGSVGRDYYYFLLLLSAKPEIVVSGIRFR
jgi:hypothetical protein